MAGRYFDENYDFTISIAEAGTLQLELKYLAYITQDERFWKAADKIMAKLVAKLPEDGLVPYMLNVADASPITTSVSFGAYGDSYFEYLLKQYLLTNKTQSEYLDLHRKTMHSLHQQLVRRSHPSDVIYLGEKGGWYNNRMQHLTCFMGGHLGLSATQGRSLALTNALDANEKQDLLLGQHLTDTCWLMYDMQFTSLSSESVDFSNSTIISNITDNDPPLFRTWPLATKEYMKAIGGYTTDFFDLPLFKLYIPEMSSYEVENKLRPETIESLMLLYRITGDIRYRERGWQMFEAFEKYSKVAAGGYAGLANVQDIKANKVDLMETFFLAETLKYFYLLFSSPNVVPLDKYVFNTEAHPFPIFEPPAAWIKKTDQMSKE